MACQVQASANEESGEIDYLGKDFSKEDFCIQSDLIEGRQILSMQNKKLNRVHPVASQKLVKEFDPESDIVDKFILDHMSSKHLLPK
jgi:hypothetical protein